MKINIHLEAFIFFNVIKKTQSDLKLWNDGNRVKQTPFWSIQSSKRSSQSPLATL
jgi:hypothetical protein